MNDDDAGQRSGLVALVGRPNVGKSSLVNALVGEKVSIVTHKAQTTRQRVVGVLTRGAVQIGLVDTPGLHGDRKRALNRRMNDTAAASLDGVDAALLIVEAGRWAGDDDRALAAARAGGRPLGLAINKVDRERDKAALLPFIQACAARHPFDFVVPVSARRGDNLEALFAELAKRMPAGEFLFPEDEYTDRGIRFIAAETVREKLTLLLHRELPYALAVTVDACDEGAESLHIAATIWVARDSHKGIVIGAGGAVLKEVGRRARLELARRWARRVDLRLWVKLRAGWPDDEAAISALQP